ncbi:MAG: alanine racemase [Janthinobacterium lividum]
MKSWIEIAGARLRANFEAIRTVAPGFEVLGVIKADAYGHGAAVCAPVLVEAGARWLGVADLDEGLCVRTALDGAGDTVHVIVMCGFEPGDAAGIVAAGLTPVVWTATQVRALAQAAKEAGRTVTVHLEIDTGMARQGAAPGEALAEVLHELRSSPMVRCEGVFSHLSSSEVVESAETARQQAGFERALQQVSDAEIHAEWVHLGNSSAGDEGSTTQWMPLHGVEAGAKPMWRPGLALYGYALPLTGLIDGKAGLLRAQLRPVATWKTRVIGLREIAAGDTVGYGATFLAEKPMRLALLPVGYADGFRREASSGVGDGWVMIGGQRALVVGRVSMNLIVVDVTAINSPVNEGDEVVLLGEGVTAEDHAGWCGTISYEILCGMRGHRRLV